MTLPEPLETEVLENRKFTKDTFLLKLKLPKPLDFRAGQFIQTITQIKDKKIRRSWSIASSPNIKDYIELLIKSQNENSLISSKLLKIKPKNKVTIQGPFGVFRIITPYKKEIFFIAAGVGVAPLRSMILDLLENKINTNITLIFGFKAEQDYLLKEEWKKLQKKYKNFKFIPVISRPQTQTELFTGRVTNLLPNLLKPSEDKDFYICGPPIMITDTVQVLGSIGFTKKQIHIERWQ
ncbi:MAG: FAD-dependent oxidoreductase [Nanoarchaeota archaeon]